MSIDNPELLWCEADHIQPSAWSGHEKAWLTYPGSLTTQLRYVTEGELEHRLRSEHFGYARSDELHFLGVEPNEAVWIREIEWWCRGELAIVARVVIPKKSLTGKGHKLKDIGRRSLGDVLFSDSNLKRSPFEILKSTDEKSRRSLFTCFGQPVLVQENFLSPIFKYPIERKPKLWRTQIVSYWRLMRFDRPIGSLLLLWPTLWALWIAAKGLPNLKILIVFIVGVILMRAAGCIINDFADRKIDSYVKRTKKRPLATGQVSEKEAIILFIVLCLIAFSLVLLLNGLTILFAFVGVALTVIYPFMKRYTHLPQFVLGFAFSWGIPMAFAAQTGAVPLVGWLLFIASVLWSVVYDTQYAMVDRDDDLRIGVKSTAILFGRSDRLIIGGLQAIVLMLLLSLGAFLGLTIWYQFALIVPAALMLYQQYLIRNCEPKACSQAFLNNNWLGFFVFLAFVLGFLAK